jgi:hypothetical protein
MHGDQRLAVAIMAKAPRPGEVKTRLCPPLTAAEAAGLYRCFLLDKIEQVRTLDGATPVIAFAPEDGAPVFQALAPGFALVPQRGEGLGARLAACFDRFFADGYAGALLIDSDTPTLPGGFLLQALHLLGEPDTDLVLGPSEDGGYYLVGLRAAHPELFRDIPWSTPRVLPETLGRARARGLHATCLPPWFDVDTGADLERLRAWLRATPGPAPRHTRAFFEGRPP